jgi:hypothetical protein
MKPRCRDLNRLDAFHIVNERRRSRRRTGNRQIQEQSLGCGDCKGSGGARRDRTADPLLAKQVLSQLSYGPAFTRAIVHPSAVATLIDDGGSGWIRTTDLTLIRGAL